MPDMWRPRDRDPLPGESPRRFREWVLVLLIISAGIWGGVSAFIGIPLWLMLLLVLVVSAALAWRWV